VIGRRTGWGWRLGAALLVLGAALRAGAEERSGASITIYQGQGGAGQYTFGGVGYGGQVVIPAGSFALVAERRSLDLVRGKNTITVRGVAARLDPTTVRFRSATDPAGTKITEQVFAHDLASPDGLLERQLDKEIAVVTAAGEVRGKLLSYDAAHLVLDTGDAAFPIRLVKRGDNVRDIRFAAPKGGLVAEPTLTWKVNAARAGRHAAEISYRTSGLLWSADYTAILNKGSVDLSGWVTVANHSGTGFRGARVALAQTAAEATGPVTFTGYAPGRPEAARTHVFPLDQPMDLRAGAAVQLELFEPQVAARGEELVVYEPLVNNAIYVSGYPNTDCMAYQYQAVKAFSEKYLEVSLPSAAVRSLPDGRARLYRRGAGDALELVAEETVVSAGSRSLRLRTGTTEEVKGERRQLTCQPDPSGRQMTEKIEVKVHNKLDRAAQVVVREHMQRWSNWAVQEESIKGKQVGVVSREYRIKVPANASKSLTYTVQYSW
jgi:hypothetical protein